MLYLRHRSELAEALLPPPCVFGKVVAAETLCHILRLRGSLKTGGPVCKSSPTRYIAEERWRRGWSCTLENVLNFQPPRCTRVCLRVFYTKGLRVERKEKLHRPDGGVFYQAVAV